MKGQINLLKCKVEGYKQAGILLMQEKDKEIAELKRQLAEKEGREEKDGR